jgi:hypothetical protein
MHNEVDGPRTTAATPFCSADSGRRSLARTRFDTQVSAAVTTLVVLKAAHRL